MMRLPWQRPLPTNDALNILQLWASGGRPTNGIKQGGYELGVFVRRRGFGRTRPETIGDNRTEFIRILCSSKSEAGVTSNKIIAL